MHRSEGRLVRLYVGNLPFSTTDEDLRQLFETHGELVSANVVRDRDTGRSRGFGFVEFSSDEQAQAAMSALDGSDMGGRALTVNEARERRSGFGGGGGGGGYGGGRGGGGYGGGGGGYGGGRGGDRGDRGDRRPRY